MVGVDGSVGLVRGSAGLGAACDRHDSQSSSSLEVVALI